MVGVMSQRGPFDEIGLILRRVRGAGGLDGAALVHGAIAVGRFRQRQGEVEYAAWVDLPVFDQADQLGQESADGSGAAVRP